MYEFKKTDIAAIRIWDVKQIVGVADMKLSNDLKDSIVAYSLGSCIGLVIYDPQARVGGILHYMLPDSSVDKSKAQVNPFMFADTAIPKLFEQSDNMGADRTRLQIYIAGGAEIMNQASLFNIGKNNVMAVEKAFSKNQVSIHKQAVGGSANRTIRLEIATGDVYLKTAGSTEEKL